MAYDDTGFRGEDLFHTESQSDPDSGEDSIGRDPLGFAPRSPRRRRVPSNETPLLDLTTTNVVRVRYPTAQGQDVGFFRCQITDGQIRLLRSEPASDWMEPRIALGPPPRPAPAPVPKPPPAPAPKPQPQNEKKVPTAAMSGPSNGQEVQDLVDGKGWRIAIRQYQLDLYRAALRRNVIAYLDTGAGKTFISVLLIRDVAAQMSRLREKGDFPKKSIFFLVPRKVLVHQQSDVLKQFTDLVVSAHSGDRHNEDSWDRATWLSYIDSADVLVMTPQILLNLLRKQVTQMSLIALIVFDECHHARKNSPYNCIMQDFYHRAKAEMQPTPKIFGMTASLVTRKRNEDEVYHSFLELENNLDSVILTTSRENVQRHATSANETDVFYAMDTTAAQFPEAFRLLEKASVRLTVANKLCIQHHHGRKSTSGWQADSKKTKGPLETQIRQIGNVQHVVKMMGPLAGSYAVSEVADGWQERESKKLSTWNFPSAISQNLNLAQFDERISRHSELRCENLGGLTETLYRSMVDISVAILTAMLSLSEAAARRELEAAMHQKPLNVKQVKIAMRQLCGRSLDLAKIETAMQVGPDELQQPVDTRFRTLISHRMQQLLKVLVLEKSKIPIAQLSNWRGMIFVQQTLMAIVLEHVLSLPVEQLKFFKCQSLTGHNGSIVSASMADHHQRKIVEMFRSGRANLLISTSVAEEGLDITQCSMVIRFDLPFTEASYIQSRGRARKPGSSYFMFIDRDDPQEESMIKHLRFAEECMKYVAAYRQQQDDMEEDEDMLSGTQDAYLEISRSEDRSLIKQHAVDSESGLLVAPEMVYKYVQQLPQDEYCQLTPNLIFRSREGPSGKEFQYQLTLPVNAALTRPIVGEWCHSKIKAKRSACYIACCELRNLGELTQYFHPIPNTERLQATRKTIKSNAKPLTVETPLEPVVLRLPATQEGGERTGFAMGTSQRMAMHLRIVISRPVEDASGFDINGQDAVHFGILTLRRLEHLMNFPLYPETGTVDVRFDDAGEVEVTAAELVELKRYHLAMVEALYFKTKLFTTVCREKKDHLAAFLDEGLQFLPEQLKRHEDKIPYVNQSWYLLCPVHPRQNRREHLDPLQKASDSDDGDISMDEDDGTAYRLDWSEIQKVGRRVLHLHDPGILKLGENLSSLRRGTVVLSPYNNAAYRLVGIRSDLSLNSSFPSKPKAEFYDPAVTKEYRGTFVPNRSGREFSTFLEYYTQHWKFEGLDPDQPLLECVSFKQIAIMKKAKNLLNPVWRQAMDIDVAEEPRDDWNLAVHVIPQLVVLYPIDYPLWQSLSFAVAVCWKLESMLKVEELRQELFYQGEQIYPNLTPPDVALIYESVTSKSCHEHCTYERLEFLGDAVLKYIASLYCFFKFPAGHEGVLTTQRSHIISNRQLATVAVSMGLQKYIRTVQLGDHPWRPAGCQFLDACWQHLGMAGEGHSWFGGRTQKASRKNQMHQSKVCTLQMKQVADVMEALLGACYVVGKVPCVCALMDRMGILEQPASFLVASSNEDPHKAWLREVSRYRSPGLEGLENFEALRERDFEHGREIRGLEYAIGYHFECPSFALEALTHCSWPHSDPPCYQRLEYLGDAVLDFMMSVYYYETYEDIDPGSLTALRSASVNNDRLAVTAIKTELYKYLLHFSSYLQSHITEYVSIYADGEMKTGAPKVLGDVVESLIGAVYLDLNGDIEQTQRVWDPLLQPYYTPSSVPIHPVVQLITFCHNRGLELEFVNVKGAATSSAPSEIEASCDDDTSDSDDDDEEDWIEERLCGKQALMQVDISESTSKKHVRVVVNGKVVGEGQGLHLKGAKKQAAVAAMETAPWDML